MRTPRVYNTEAVVLRVRRMGEADSVLTLFSADQGKFEAVARGVRKLISRKAGHLEPLTQSRLKLAHGSTLDVITEAEAVNTFIAIRDDLLRSGAGLYLAELVDRFTVERQENWSLYRLLVETLQRLADAGSVELALRFFEANLLAETGFRPQLYRCVTCNQDLQPVLNAFSVAAGGVVCRGCVPAGSGLPPISVNAVKVLRLMLRGEYPAVARLLFTADLGEELESILRLAIYRQLEREPRSLTFLREMRNSYRARSAAAVERPREAAEPVVTPIS
jgi:DNA repair protein RecO (recombination protein O)